MVGPSSLEWGTLGPPQVLEQGHAPLLGQGHVQGLVLQLERGQSVLQPARLVLEEKEFFLRDFSPPALELALVLREKEFFLREFSPLALLLGLHVSS